MKTAKQFFENQLITDASSVIDKNAHKFSRHDLINFAEAYAYQRETINPNNFTNVYVRSKTTEGDSKFSIGDKVNYCNGIIFKIASIDETNQICYDKGGMWYALINCVKVRNAKQDKGAPFDEPIYNPKCDNCGHQNSENCNSCETLNNEK